MSQLLEVLGKGLVSSLWCIFGKHLSRFEGKVEPLRIRLVERPNDPELLITAAVSCYRGGKYDQALLHLDRLAAQDAGYQTEIAMTRACVFEALGHRDKAIDVLKELDSRMEEPNAGVLFSIGELCETTERVDEAMEYYTRAAEISSSLYNAHQRLAAIRVVRGQIERAIEHYQQLCHIDPMDTEARVTLGCLLLNSGQPRRAVGEFQVALTIEPDNWALQNDLVAAQDRAGQYEQAIDTLKQLMDKHGEFPDSYLQMAELEIKLGRDDEAMDCFQKALELHPNYLEAIVKFGTHHLRMGRYIEAAETFSRAVETNDRLLNAYVGLAVAQQHAGWTDRAAETIDLAVAVEPNTTMLFGEIAKLELKASAAEKAQAYLKDDGDPAETGSELLRIQTDRFSEALQQCPNRADWHYRYGLLLKAQGHTAQAIGAFEEAVAINPHYVKAMVKLGLSLFELGETDRARSCLEQAVTLEPSYADLHYQLGLIYANQQSYYLAVEEFENSLKRNGGDVRVRVALAQALENIGMVDRARASWKAVLELAPHTEQAKLAEMALEN